MGPIAKLPPDGREFHNWGHDRTAVVVSPRFFNKIYDFVKKFARNIGIKCLAGSPTKLCFVGVKVNPSFYDCSEIFRETKNFVR
jgi:hypothetical protein